MKNVFEVSLECYPCIFNGIYTCYHYVRDSRVSHPYPMNGFHLAGWTWSFGPNRDHFAELKDPSPKCHPRTVAFLDKNMNSDAFYSACPPQNKIFTIPVPEIQVEQVGLQKCLEMCNTAIGGDCWRVAVVNMPFYETEEIYLDSNANPGINLLCRGSFGLATPTSYIAQIVFNLKQNQMLYISLGQDPGFQELCVKKDKSGSEFIVVTVNLGGQRKMLD